MSRHTEQVSRGFNYMPTGHHPKTEFKKGHPKPKNAYKFPKGHNGYGGHPPVGKPSGMLGKHPSDKTRRKMSEAKKGNKACNWKGGIESENKRIRKSIDFRLWREAVFARDNWTCQKYGIRGGKLHPHHIENFSDFPELRFAIDNGITLSDKAHKEFHKIYGCKNNTKEQIDDFLKSE